MSLNLTSIGKKLSEYGGDVGRFFGGAAQGLGNVANQTSKVVGNTVLQAPIIKEAVQFGQQRNPTLGGLVSGISETGYRYSPLGSLERTGGRIAATLTNKPQISLLGVNQPVGQEVGNAAPIFNNKLFGQVLAAGNVIGDIAGGASPFKVPVRPVIAKINQSTLDAYKHNPILSNQQGYINPSASVARYRPSSTGRIEDVAVQVNDLKSAIAGKGLAFQEGKKAIELSNVTPGQKLKQLQTLQDQIGKDTGVLQRELGGWQEHLNELSKSTGRPLTNPKLAIKSVQQPSFASRLIAPLRSEQGSIGLPGEPKPKPRVALRESEQKTSLAPSVAQKELPFSAKKVSNLDKAFRSTRSIIERQGEHGKQLANMLQGSRDTEELYLASLEKQLPTVKSLKGKDFENFVESTQGKAQASSPKVAQAVAEWQRVHPEIRNRAVAAGLDVGDLGSTYYPHFVDFEKIFKNKSSYNEAINHLVQTGQAPNAAEAIKALGYARDVSRNRKFGNLEASRLVDLPEYDKTPNSLVSYLKGSARRTAQTETFGAKDEKAMELIANLGKQGFDTETAKNAYDVAVGAKRYNPALSEASRKTRQYLTTTRLGLGALTNTSQNVNTGIVTGHLRTLNSMVKQLNPKTREYVHDTGVISDALLNDIREQAGFVGKGLSKITAPGFNTVEKFNRAVAATSGKDYALRLAQKGDEKTLRTLGVTGPIENKTLTTAQQIQASRKIVEKTQFKVDPQDLPGWASSPGGKLVSQFRTFSYNQGKFFSNEILKPMLKGNYVPLTRLLAALPIGYGLYEAKRVIAGRPEEKSQPRIALESFSNVGGAGLALDIFRGLNPLNGKYLPPDRRIAMALSTFGGPTTGLAADVVGGVSEATQRKKVPDTGLGNKVAVGVNNGEYTDLTPLTRTGLRQIPIVGTAIQNRALPYGDNKPTISLFPGASAAESSPLPKLPDVPVLTDNRPVDTNTPSTGKAPGKTAVSSSSILTGATGTPESKTVAKELKDYNKKAVALNLRLGGTKELDKAQTRIDAAQNKFPDNLSQDSQTVLTRYAKLNANGREKFNADTKNTLKLKLAEYERDKLNGDLTDLEDYRAQNEISKFRVASNFSPEVLKLHGMSKAALKDYFAARPDKVGLFNQVQKLDKALVANGVEDKPKFSYGLGNKGRAAGSNYKYAISINAGGGVSHPRVSVRKPSIAASRTKKFSSGKPAVSIRKSSV